MKQKFLTKKNLYQKSILIEDTSENSDEYFRIEIPNTLTAGKNLFSISPNLNTLALNSSIDIEILDSYGNPIYFESINQTSDSGAQLLSAYVYTNTPIGNAYITVIGVASRDLQGNTWNTNKYSDYNIRWQKRITVNKNLDNVSDIIFTIPPTASISEIRKPLYTRTYPSSSRYLTKTFSGTFKYEIVAGKTYVLANSSSYTSDMLGGDFMATKAQLVATRSLDTLGNLTSGPYTASIINVLNDTTLELSVPYKLRYSDSNNIYIFDSANLSSHDIKYEQQATLNPISSSFVYGETTSTYSPTASFVYMVLSNLDTLTGNVSKVKVYSKSSAHPGILLPFNGYDSPGMYVPVSEIQVLPQELLIDTGSYQIDKPIGKIESTSDITTYWLLSTGSAFASSVSASYVYSNSNLMNSIYINDSNYSSSFISNQYFILKTSSSYYFNKDTEYDLTFNAYTEPDTKFNSSYGNNQLNIYLLGNCVANSSLLDFSQAKLVGTLSSTNQKTLLGQKYTFTTDTSGSAQLAFVILSGKWNLSNISIRPSSDKGFTPNILRIVFPIPTIQPGEVNDFKIEYLNVNDKKSNYTSILQNVLFSGSVAPAITNISALTATSASIDYLFVSSSLVLPSSSSAQPQTGSVYLKNNNLYIYNGSVWKSASLS